MSDETMTQSQPIEDSYELPPAPHSAEPEGGDTDTPVDGTIDAGVLDTVPKMGDPFPKGTYHFRLDGYTEGWNETPADRQKTEEFIFFGDQPYFMLRWICQQEPHVGKMFMEWCDWVNQETLQALSGSPNSPKFQAARKLVNQRVWRVKEIMDKAGYKPVGKTDVKTFFETNPEVKIQLATRERKTKDASGRLKGTGEIANRAIRYLSIFRGA